MTTPPMQSQINQCIAVYERVTGFTNGRGLFANVMSWSEFVRSGFTPEQLEFVLRHLMRQIQKGERRIACLRVSTLILDTQRFGEELDLAQAMERNRPHKPSPKQRVLEQFRRAPEPAQRTDARPISDYIAELRRAAL